jgi:hypothetical protein
MIITSDKEFFLQLPIFQKCNLDPCNKYLILLQNNFTKECWLFKVLNFSNNHKLRFLFRFDIPKCMERGEYTYYLITNNDWDIDNINIDNIKNSVDITNKMAITNDGLYIINYNVMLVTSGFKALLYDCDDIIVNDKVPLQFEFNTTKDDDGFIVKYLNIIQTGLFKYVESNKICCESPQFQPTQNIYTQFNY